MYNKPIPAIASSYKDDTYSTIAFKHKLYTSGFLNMGVISIKLIPSFGKFSTVLIVYFKVYSTLLKSIYNIINLVENLFKM